MFTRLAVTRAGVVPSAQPGKTGAADAARVIDEIEGADAQAGAGDVDDIRARARSAEAAGGDQGCAGIAERAEVERQRGAGGDVGQRERAGRERLTRTRERDGEASSIRRTLIAPLPVCAVVMFSRPH